MAAETLLVVAGDPSGDAHGASLIEALKQLRPQLRVAAVGGSRMKAEADEFIEDLASRGTAGFIEPFKALPYFARLLSRLSRFMAEKKPRAVVCIDYYGFNSRVLKAAKKHRIPAYYYISPQVWASRAGRIKTLKSLVKRMFVIFPFEEKLYKNAGVDSLFVGHPLLDILPPAHLNGGLKAPLKVGLLPGSRRGEVTKHLPLFLEAFQLLRRHFPDAQAKVFASDNLDDDVYSAARGQAALVRESDYRERRGLDLAISSSGTATLENALLGIPMVVVYKMSWPTYAIARAVIKVRHISMANILAGRALVPELIQHHATASRIAQAAVSLLENPARLLALKKDLAGLRRRLGLPGASARAAKGILEGIKA